MAVAKTLAGVTIRRISWADLYRERPDLRPANDNRPAPAEKAA